jgi:hypothetical protein
MNKHKDNSYLSYIINLRYSTSFTIHHTNRALRHRMQELGYGCGNSTTGISCELILQSIGQFDSAHQSCVQGLMQVSGLQVQPV